MGFLGEIEIAKELFVLAALISLFGVIQIVAGTMRSGGRDKNGFMEIVNDLFDMPKTMRQLAVVQFFSWFAMFSMWIYGTPAVAEFHFNAPDPATKAYQDAADWWSLLGAVRNGVAAVAALGFIWIVAKMDRRRLHSMNLLIGAAGFSSLLFIRDPQLLWISMVGVGVAWASIVSLPYAILAGSVPAAKMGVYMGIFNIFIVVPQLVAATLLGFLLSSFFNSEPIWALMISAGSFVLAAVATLFVTDVLDPAADDPARVAQGAGA
jgi:maltose/moltooligosaccharide transporter